MNSYDNEHIDFVDECLERRLPYAMRAWQVAFYTTLALLSSFAERSSK